jgi:2-polyprenyl-3-methyl-5-hydroxy-6-metoxy-1,4-benzoquinol methylase
MILRGQLGRVSAAVAFNAGLLIASVVLAQQPDAIQQERKGWDQVFAKEELSFSKEPNAFLVRSISAHPPGRALDVGMGQGRNTFWLAEHGWTVTGFDISPIRLSRRGTRRSSGG